MNWETARRRWKRWANLHPENAGEIPKQTSEQVVGTFMYEINKKN